MKRIVTGHDASGKSVFVSVGEPDHRIEVTALGWRELWSTYADDRLPLPDLSRGRSRDPRWTSVFPRVGETMFRILEYRPEEGVGKSPFWNEAEIDLIRRELPGTLERLEPDDPGMHTTDSVDYGIVLSGRIGLELDDGAIVELEAGDVVVQNGTRHAWRPRERAVMAFVLVGVPRREEQGR
jgi:mannose-6-phosphate isomerase-like protein (cupin superfamily)